MQIKSRICGWQRDAGNVPLHPLG